MEPEWLGLTYLLLTLFTQKKLPLMLAQSADFRLWAVTTPQRQRLHA